MSQGPIAVLINALVGGVAKPVAMNADGSLEIVAGANGGYVKCPASATTPLGSAGKAGDVINSLTYVPGTTAAGVVTLVDGSGGGAVSIPLFVGGGTTALIDLRPVTVLLNLKSKVGGWNVTLGANMTAVAVGSFSS